MLRTLCFEMFAKLLCHESNHHFHLWDAPAGNHGSCVQQKIRETWQRWIQRPWFPADVSYKGIGHCKLPDWRSLVTHTACIFQLCVSVPLPKIIIVSRDRYAINDAFDSIHIGPVIMIRIITLSYWRLIKLPFIPSEIFHKSIKQTVQSP